MNKPQKIVIGFFVLSFLVIATLYFISSTSEIKNPENDKIIIYYGITCPHCKIVEEYIKNKSIDSKLEIIQKEVYVNKTNAGELIKAGQICKIQKEYIGSVPLIYFNRSCYLGDKDAIEFLDQQVKILEEKE